MASASSAAQLTLQAPVRLRGRLTVPGDKSISHRAVLLNAVARGTAEISHFLTGADCLSTIECVRALGVEVERSGTNITVHGVGLHGLREPTHVLDCGNSGTTLRLLTGLLAGQPFFSVLTGDSSLRSRPQQRITRPLRELGATLDGRNNGDRAPLTVRGTKMKGGRYDLPVASAQVKSALLLAALPGEGSLTLGGLIDTRDHTERMLAAMGVDLGIGLAGAEEVITLHPPEPGFSRARLPAPLSLRVPGDPSSATFWWVAAALHPDAELTTPGVCLNPTRTGALEILQAMGADITIENQREEGSEPVGDVTVRSSALRGTTIGGDMIPRLIDEIPILALAATYATGETVIRDAQELRVKETDRIATVVEGLRALGSQLDATDDGMVVAGNGGQPLQGAGLVSHGDHRLAMTWGIAALVARGETTIDGTDAAQVSYPDFWTHLAHLQTDG